MKRATPALIATFVGGSLLTASLAFGAGSEERGPQPVPGEAARESPAPYTTLVELTTRVCTGAAEAFRGFFAPAVVRVRPFLHLAAVANDSSVLGVTLADQMAAMLNGHANAAYGNTGGDQQLEGVMQEMDGYLRIHMLATNARGEHRSHVAMVEMSSPLYRALHSYAEDRRPDAYAEKKK